MKRFAHPRAGTSCAGRVKRLLATSAAALAIALAVGPAVPSAYADAIVTSEEELHAAVAAAPTDGTETIITVGSELTLTSGFSIAAGQNIRMVDDGHARIIHTQLKHDTVLITAAAGSTLTVATSTPDNSFLVFDATDETESDGRSVLELVNSQGSVHWQGGTVTYVDFGHRAERGVLTVHGTDASLVVDEGLFTKNSGGYIGGILNASAGASVTMNGGTITDNDCSFMKTDGAPVYIGAYDSTMEHPTRFVMNGGTISHNTGAAGGIFVGNTDFKQAESFGGMAVATINAGTITQNRAAQIGGGVFVSMAGELTMSGGSITNNEADRDLGNEPNVNGGGVGVWDYWDDYYAPAYAEQGWTPEEIRKQFDEVWSKASPARFVMNGGVISGNHADWCGGGVYASSAAVELNAGVIENNTADGRGGGVCLPLVSNKAKLRSAIVSGNTAQELGGGIWICPIGTAHMELNDGGAIYDNASHGAGNDVVSLAKDDGSIKLNIAERMLGGGRVTWFDDGAATNTGDHWVGEPDCSAPRYQDGSGAQPYEGAVTVVDKHLALAAQTTDEGKAAAEAAGKLFIRNNSAAQGGGIGTNGVVIFGEQDASVAIPVRKVWQDDENAAGLRPGQITVKLMRDGVPIDTALLNADNGWQHTFSSLPAHKDGAMDAKSVYTVSEEAIEGYATEIAGDADQGFVITNTSTVPAPKPEPEPGPQPEPGPAPKPEPGPGKQPTPDKKPDKRQEALPQTGDQTALMVGCVATASMVMLGIGSIAVRKRER